MISLEEMSKEELVELHHKIADRLRYLYHREAQDKMTNFYFGDVVTFVATDGRIIRGTIEKFNQKSITLKDEAGHPWRVSPQLLKKVPTSVLSVPYKTIGS